MPSRRRALQHFSGIFRPSRFRMPHAPSPGSPLLRRALTAYAPA
ncbi:hypothetical protein C7S15_7623 [Burkholderia cepacia]|nr:hypothetical protein [Burkholderia cepacia]